MERTQPKDVASSAIATCCPRSPWNSLGRQGCTTITKWIARTWAEVLSGYKVIRSKKQKYCEQRFGRNLQKKPQNGPEWSLFWGISLGTSSLQSIPHPIYAYTFCSQQASAVGDFCHLLLSQTSELLPILTVVGHSQVSH